MQRGPVVDDRDGEQRAVEVGVLDQRPIAQQAERLVEANIGRSVAGRRPPDVTADPSLQHRPLLVEVRPAVSFRERLPLLAGHQPELRQQGGQHVVIGRPSGRHQRRGAASRLEVGQQLPRTSVVDRQAHADPGQTVAVGGGVGAQLDGAEHGMVLVEDAHAEVHGPPRVGPLAAGDLDHGADAQRGRLVDDRRPDRPGGQLHELVRTLDVVLPDTDLRRQQHRPQGLHAVAERLELGGVGGQLAGEIRCRMGGRPCPQHDRASERRPCRTPPSGEPCDAFLGCLDPTRDVAAGQTGLRGDEQALGDVEVALGRLRLHDSAVGDLPRLVEEVGLQQGPGVIESERTHHRTVVAALVKNPAARSNDSKAAGRSPISTST